MAHPFDSLSVEEINNSARIIKEHFKGQSLIFNSITRLEPRKSAIFPKLLLENEGKPVDFSTIDRRSFTILIIKDNDDLDKDGRVVEVVVNLKKGEIELLKNVSRGKQPTFTPDECILLERLTHENEEVQKKCADLGYFDMSLVVADPWPYGYFGDEPGYENRRIAQMFMYGKEYPEDNHYAHPMNFVPVFDTHSGKLIKIMEQPAHSDFDPKPDSDLKIPRGCGNYEEKLLGDDFYRTSIKPLHISCPEGPSFKIDGNLIEWEKFRLRISFNQREGLVLHNVTYTDGKKVRPLLYRAALSEMVVPYGDPRPPFNRKCAFDVGESSLGFCVNSLALGCDCLGTIKYFDAFLNNEKGEATTIKNAVCLHEEDAGVLWKHTNYRTGSVSVTRSRVLVLSFIVTVVNYEYGFYWKFAQDGTISYEVKATGILSTNLLASEGEGSAGPQFGTKVADNVIALYHQHLFCVRLDTAIDGLDNTVSTVDVVPLPDPVGSKENPFGQGFTTRENKLRNSKESCTQISPFTSRTWKISNPSSINTVTGKPSGWKLIPNNSQTLIAHPDSEISRRAAFARNSVCVTPFKDDQIYAAGFYVNQSQGRDDDDDGLKAWISDQDNIENTDIVLWHTFGLTHIPRVEDYPVMPVETCGFTLKPNNFFQQNPSLDVPSQKRVQGGTTCSKQVN